MRASCVIRISPKTDRSCCANSSSREDEEKDKGDGGRRTAREVSHVLLMKVFIFCFLNGEDYVWKFPELESVEEHVLEAWLKYRVVRA